MYRTVETLKNGKCYGVSMSTLSLYVTVRSQREICIDFVCLDVTPRTIGSI